MDEMIDTSFHFERDELLYNFLKVLVLKKFFLTLEKFWNFHYPMSFNKPDYFIH